MTIRRSSQKLVPATFDECLAGGGEMGSLMRSIDWARTPLGPVAKWPASLRTMVTVVLGNRFPMCIWWGPELRHLYNDGYRPMLGAKHPASIGQPGSEVWAEIWDVVGPMAAQIMRGGPATFSADLLLEMNRYGYIEETYFTFAYSPIPGERGVGGLLITVQETTTQVLTERRLKTLRDLAVRSAEAQTAEDALIRAADILAVNRSDVPFALFYLVDAEGDRARLVSSTGLGRNQAVGEPVIALNRHDQKSWPLGEAERLGHSLELIDLAQRFAPLPGGPWPEPARRAMIIPLRRLGQRRPYGFMVAGLSPRLEVDVRYSGFVELAADQIAIAIANALAHQEERQRAAALAEVDQERRLLLQREQEARAAAEEASRAKDEFLAMLGHELRNPLSPILTSLNLMRMRGTEVFLREREIIERQVQHLVSLVDDLLDVSRITQGKIQLKVEPTELITVAVKAIEMASPIIEQRIHHLSAIIPPAGLQLEADPSRLAQVICNLLTNAAKYTEPGGNIWIRAERENDQIILRVRDNGIGIAPAMLPRVFDLFSQGTRALDRSQGGLGIGLTIVKSLIDLHGGLVEAHSEGLGTGSEFVIHLPAAKPAAAAEVTAEARVPKDGASDESLAPRRKIFIVDDNRDAAEVLGEALEASGYLTRIAFDAPSALETVESFHPDAMLIDIGLPVMDGYELARRLRANPQLASARLIAVTGYGQESDRRQALEAGFNEHLVKPIDFARLEALLREQLSS
jgi:signal transduction histidine kinase